MEESDLQDHRRKRLRIWLSTKGEVRTLLRSRGLDDKEIKVKASHISQVLSGAALAGRGARNMEKLLGMDAGYLDDLTEGLTAMALEVAMLFDEVAPVDRQKRADAFSAVTAALNKFREGGQQGGDSLSHPKFGGGSRH